MMNIKKLGFDFMLFLALIFSKGAHAEPIAPDALVKNTANEVIEIVKSDIDIRNGDMNKLGKLVEEKIATKFDFERISRMALGRKWNIASKEQQAEFIVEFRSLLVRTYSSALSKYKNQAIEYKPLPTVIGDTEDIKIKTQIIQPGGPSISLEYSLEKIEATWEVYDISIDGISLVTTYRGQFAEEIKRTGINGVIQKLAEKNKRSPQSINPA
jgi:phospholipid transport system substrate-binding protein